MVALKRWIACDSVPTARTSLGLSAALLMLSGCSTTAVESVHVTSTPSSITNTSGLYYLPKALFRIKLERTESFSVCEKKRDASGNEVAIDPAHQVKELVDVSFSLSYLDKVIVPDPDYAYTIAYDESVWSSDKLTVDVSDDGLLDRIHFKAEDTTDKIVLQVVELAEQAAKAFISFGEVSTSVTAASALQSGETCILARIEKDDPKIDLTASFDPLSRREIDHVNSAIKQRIQSDKLYLDIQKSRQPITDKSFPLAPANECSAGICYRPAEAFDLVLFTNNAEYDRTSIIIPTKDKIVGIPISRATFVEKTTTIDFEGGLLKQVDITKPSEALEIVSLPVEILKAIVAIPAELIQLKIDTTNKEKTLLDAQSSHIETQLKLLEAQEKLLEKQQEIIEKNQKTESPEQPEGMTSQ